MKKPTLKVEVAIDMIFPASNLIVFYATSDAASEFSEFGEVHTESQSCYHLFVDARYDLDEVVEYIKEYNNE